MKIVNSYADIVPAGLQVSRLYLQSRPLVSYWRKNQKNIPYTCPNYITLIDQELTSEYVAIDCGGWYFSNTQRACVAIELHEQSKKLWSPVFLEYDYLTWHPDYLKPVPVLAYYSSYFKYCEFKDIVTFFNSWGVHHPKLIVGLDPTKVKFNYLKYNFLDLLKDQLTFDNKITILEQSNFNLLFTVEKL